MFAALLKGAVHMTPSSGSKQSEPLVLRSLVMRRGSRIEVEVVRQLHPSGRTGLVSQDRWPRGQPGVQASIGDEAIAV